MALHLLDLLGVEKRECHRPGKHFLLTGEGVKLLDFERARIREGQIKKNVLQFLSAVYRALKSKKLIEMAKNYRNSNISFEELLTFISSLQLPRAGGGKARR